MSNYFQNFPTLQYNIYGTGKTIELVDIFRSVRLKKSTRDNVLLYTYYTVKNGERPDHLSMELYGTPDYYWTFFMVNENIVNLTVDWPLTYDELNNKINRMYSGYIMNTDTDISKSFTVGETLQGLISGATTTILEKDANLGQIKIGNITGEFRDGEIVIGLTSLSTCQLINVIPFRDATHHYEDANGYITDKQQAVGIVTNAEYEIAQNELKTNIRIIRPEYIQRVAEEFFKQINPEAQ